MNSIMKKISCLLIGACLVASVTANNVSNYKQVKGAKSVDQIEAMGQTKAENSTKVKLQNGKKVDPAVQANIEKQEYYRSINSNINIDSGNSSYTSLDRECDDNALTLTVDGGAWQSEVSWELLGADGTSLYSGGAPSTTELCLLDGDYTFVANDAFGDGWNGNTANFTDADGSLLASFTLATGATESFAMTVPFATVVAGCTDPDAENYDDTATLDDGSCTYNGGCSSPFQTACDDGLCVSTSFFCDGSSEYGNASWGADCLDGSDEGAACCGSDDPYSPYTEEVCVEDCAGDVLGGAVEDCAGVCNGDSVLDDCGVCDGDGSSCDCDTFTLNMVDSFGDGWNGNQFCVNDECVTLETGTDGTASFCIDLSATNDISCGGGSWPGEVSWTLTNDATGEITLEGGAPFVGCLGFCPDVYGCMLEDAPNYNPDATQDDGSCEQYPGADYGYWNASYPGFYLGCDLYYIFADCTDETGLGIVCPEGEGDGIPNALGDGSCTDFGDATGNGINEGLACEAFGCDGGDCNDCSGDCLGSDLGSECWDGSFECDIADCPDDCDTPVTFNMYDSYGDGWNGATFTVVSAAGDLVGEGTLDSGDYGFATLCMPDGDYVVTVGGGSWDSEITWDMVDADGNIFAAGAAGTFDVTAGAPPVPIPDAPSDLVVTGVMDPVNGPSLAMTWTPVEGADAYNIYIWDDTPPIDCEASWDACVESLVGTEYYEACSADDCSGGPGGECDGNVVPGLTTECGDMAGLVGSGQCPDPCPYVPTPCEESGGVQSWVADGYCDASNNTETCGYDGGDCCPGDCVDATYDCATWGGTCDDCIDPSSADLAEGGQCTDGGEPEPEICEATLYDVQLNDTYGDGWNGNALCVGAECVTLDTGSSGTGSLCIEDGLQLVTCGGGSWGSEVSWAILDADGAILLSGGSPFEQEFEFGAAGDVASSIPNDKSFVKGSYNHKMSLTKQYTNSTMFDQGNHRSYSNSGVDREGWVLLGTTVHYSEFPADYLTIYGFAYGETALLGVSSVNIAGESDIASAEGTTPDMDTPYNLEASDAGDGVVSLTWEYDGFEPAAYPDCLGNVSWIGDGWCDASNNNPDCDFDGGDCCADSCDGSDDLYSCDECDADGDGVGCGDQADADGDGIWDSCADPDFGGEYEEPEDCVELNATGAAYAGDPNGCYDDGTGALSNALEFAFEDNCGVTSIQYGTDPGELTELTGGPFFGSFFFFGFGPSETYYFILGTADGVYSDLFEASTSDYDCAGDSPEPSACADAGGNDSWVGDGYCDAINNVEACGYDSGDCCPGDCVDGPSYSCSEVGGTCATCVDPSSADLAEGGQCYDDGTGPEPILVFTIDTGAEGSAAFTIPEDCASQSLVVDGGSWQSEVSWTITAFDTPDVVAEGGAPYAETLALPAGTHVFNGSDAYGDGWNGNVATMTCAPAGVAAMDNRTYRYDYSLSNGSGLHVVQATDTYKPKPIVIDHNIDRAVTSFNVYDSNTGENVGVAFDLAFSLPSDGGCWVVTAFDDALGLESGASNEACFSGCSTAGTGDSNGDGLLNVLDVVIIVGEILEPTWDGESCESATADLNDDGLVNVLDIVIIVGEILEGRTVDANSATIFKADNGVTIEADGFVAGIEMKISHDTDFSIELTNNAMVAKHVTKENVTHLIVVAPEDDVIFTSNGDFTIDEVIAANTNGDYINLTNGLPTVFGLSAAYPNPFNPVTNMELSLVNEVAVSMNVYNVSGQLVDVLVDGVLDAGYHSITWDAANISSGVYFVKVIAGSNVSMQKVMLLK